MVSVVVIALHVCMYVCIMQGECCFVTMLICDIAKMQNVLDFPLQLAIVQRELSLGQRYLARPVGLLDPKEVSVDVLQTAFQAAIPSLVGEHRMYVSTQAHFG